MKKYSFLYELPLFYALLYGINRVFLPEYPAYIGIDPHPYWAGILLFGLRYGVWAGLVTGLVSAGLYLGIAWQEVEGYLLEDFNFYLLPLFFILGGTLIGVGVNRYRARIRALQEAEKERQAEMKKLVEEIQTLQMINQGLEKRIVTRMATLVTLYEGAKRLETSRVSDIYPAILEFVSKTLEVEEAALYLKSPTGWDLLLSYGWKEYHQRPEKIDALAGITGTAGSKNKIVSVRDYIGTDVPNPDAPQVMGDALMAGPLRNGEKGEVVGVFAVQKIPFLQFNSATISLFSFLLEWASRALGRASYLEELKSKEIIDSRYLVYSRSYFFARLEQEFARSKTYYLPLSIGLVQVSGLSQLKPAQRDRTILALSRLLKDNARDMDVVANYGEEDVPLAILWVTASPKQTEEMIQKIRENFKRLELPGLELNISTSAFGPQMKTSEELIVDAERALKR